MDKKLVIVGASGHGKVVADIAKLNGYNEIIFLDDNTDAASCAGYPVKGVTADAPSYKHWDFFVAIGNIHVRENILRDLLSKGYSIATLIHPAATIASDSTIEKGTVVMAGAVINSDTRIGCGCIINTCASVDHDCIIDNFTHVSVGAHICGTVLVGACTLVGAGSVIINNLKIAPHSIIGAGSVVIKNIEKTGTYVGTPAKKIK